MIGTTIDHYRIVELIGRGGMGVVYKAHDTHLDRNVAVKILPAEAMADMDRKRRFVQEARAASALNHSNIITIYDISHSERVDFIAMEYVEGCTLQKLITGSGLPLEQAVDYAVQMSGAIAAAHAAGIVHRDLKPSNFMVSDKGIVKVLDFGLAKLTERIQSSVSSGAETMTPITEQGAIVGTTAYMSPEQAEGKPVDARSDVFSFGAVLYELLTGKRAFQGESYISTLSAILQGTPTPVRKLRSDIPTALERIVNRCLEKNREARYASASEVWKDLAAVQSKFAAGKAGLGTVLWRRRFIVPALIVLAVLAAAIGWFGIRNSRIGRARTVALPEIIRLMDAGRTCAALQLARQNEAYLRDSTEFESLLKSLAVKTTIVTHPPGADVYVRDYVDAADGGQWLHQGRTPLESVAIPSGYLAYRITKPDYETVEGAGGFSANSRIQISLREKGSSPPGMVWIPAQNAGSVTVINTEPIRDLGLPGYWLDQYEVTNKQFKEFVDSGGYDKKEYWKVPFIKEGREIPWEEAVAAFRDATRRPGPATWEFGTYPPDRADYPVNGVSWYEAVAYAAYAGKSLPTVHHWACAAGNWPNSVVLQMSNFSGKGPAKLGSYRGLGPYGIYDMAGNVKEWCWNPSGTNRYILGGAWNDPSYAFLTADVRDPMDRSAVNGFRCAKYETIPAEELTGPVKMLIKDRRGDKPVSDEIYQAYKSIHQYDHGDLKVASESTDDGFPYWRLEKVSFQAAYGNERVTAYLYLPKNAKPPYQTVVLFPGAYAIETKTSQALDTSLFDFMIRSGRAVMHPIYKGTYERSSGLTFMNYIRHTNLWKEIAIDYAKDFGRSLDYLDKRPEIDRDNLAFYGFSMGANEGPRLIALEPRIKAGLLLFGGAYEREWPAELDSFNFAPRVFAPILMLGGRYDYIFSLEASQEPLFQALGTPQQNKKHRVLEVGHGGLNQEGKLEVLGWLDRYLGTVRIQ